ncbi:MAG: hypothetical protein JXR70_10880 [Spirochaetales bacterium]|nr:hypothetical protein [Spirochaetales bacterium]
MSNADHFYQEILTGFRKLAEQKGILDENITINGKILNTQEAIGIPSRDDFPLLMGKEFLMEADYKGSKGQAFTNCPGNFNGTICEITKTLPKNSFEYAVLISSMNAVGKHLGLCEKTIHCRNEGPELCAEHIVASIKKMDIYRATSNPLKIALVGYQPSFLDKLARNFNLRCLDLDLSRIGQKKFGITIEQGVDNMRDALNWADMILVTGSTLCNGTIVNYLSHKNTYFFGTTISATAALLGLKRMCFEAE